MAPSNFSLAPSPAATVSQRRQENRANPGVVILGDKNGLIQNIIISSKCFDIVCNLPTPFFV